MKELARMVNIYGDHILFNAGLNVMKGEIVGVLGMNNSGKTELVNILSGKQNCKKGIIYFEDKKVVFNSQSAANTLGIYYLRDEQQFLKNFTVAENILVMRKKRNVKILIIKRVLKECEKLIENLFVHEAGIPLKSDDYLSELNILQRMAVQIIKLININAKLIILDHYLDDFPISLILSLQKWLELLSKNLGISFVITAHKTSSVFNLCNRVFVLRSGMSVGTFSECHKKDKLLTSVMTGNIMENNEIYNNDFAHGERILAFKNVLLPGENKKLSIEVCSGETVGLCCVSQKFIHSFCEILLGENNIQSGEILFDGRKFNIHSSRTITDYGVGMVVENPGLFSNMSFSENVSIMALRKFSAKFGVINSGAVSLAMSEALAIWDSPYLLSENRKKIDLYTEKKILISRAMAILPRIMIYQNLDKGLDDFTYDRLIKQLFEISIKPKASLFISSNVQKLLKICSKIYFVYDGEVVAEVYPSATDRETLQKYFKLFHQMQLL